MVPAGIEPAPHVRRGLTAECPPPLVCASVTPPPIAVNGMTVSLVGIASATFWPERAGAVAGTFTVTVSSNGPATIVLKGSFGELTTTVPAGDTTRTFTL